MSSCCLASLSEGCCMYTGLQNSFYNVSLCSLRAGSKKPSCDALLLTHYLLCTFMLEAAKHMYNGLSQRS